jgi:predicted ATPase
VQTLRHWLADPSARLITLTGPGGAGKTRLALEIPRAIASEDTSRVVFVPLATIRDPASVASAIAEAFGLWEVTAIITIGAARFRRRQMGLLLVRGHSATATRLSVEYSWAPAS